MSGLINDCFDNMKTIYIILWKIILFVLLFLKDTQGEITDEESSGEFKIEGKVEVVSVPDKDWITNTQVLIEGGEYIAHLRGDGSFVIYGLPSGTYVVEVVNPQYMFEPAKVDITSKGKIRARKVNYLQPQVLKTVHYPLEFRERTKTNYYQMREQWKLTDILFNPLVLTMALPLLLVMVLPKMMSAADPEAQKEMQSQMKAINEKSTLPDFSEMLAGWLGGSSKSGGTKKVKSR